MVVVGFVIEQVLDPVNELAAAGDHPIDPVTRVVPKGEAYGISLTIVHR